MTALLEGEEEINQRAFPALSGAGVFLPEPAGEDCDFHGVGQVCESCMIVFALGSVEK